MVLMTAGEVAAIVYACLAFHHRGYDRGKTDGYSEGYEAGKRDEGNWWMNLEYETVKMQKQIWKEEAEW
jgi:hypothetical protein